VTQLAFTREELLASHESVRPHVVAGHRLHGSFDADGHYLPPRLLHRGPAIAAWTEALRKRGGDLLPADSGLLAGIRYPSEAQQKLLIREGLGETFWNTLTITGLIEARGRVLVDLSLPEFQTVVQEDVSEMAVGHLNGGLLQAHGLDEGGEPESGIGGHDVMWFALRDLAFGKADFPIPTVPQLSRSESELPQIPGVADHILRAVYFLCNLLMIEFRAERGFSFTENLLRDPELFTNRRSEALEAAEVVKRIRLDEEAHVASLRLYLGELRELHFQTDDDRLLPGREVVDPLWSGIVQWATVEQPKLAAEQQRSIFSERILRHEDGERILRAFTALEDAA